MDIEGNIDQIREEFDMLKYWTWLDWGNQSIPGNYWLKAQEDYLGFLRRGRIEMSIGDIGAHPHMGCMYEECRQRAAKLIHAKVNEVTHIYRVVTAFNFLIYNILRWESGDNVVFTDLTYPSNSVVLLDIHRKRGVELRRVRNVNGEIVLSDLEEKIDEKTKLVCINHTYAFCGFTYPYVKELCEIAHRNGALVVSDAAQALGAIDINVHEENIDFLISGSYKWQCGPEGAGLFYIREDLIEQFGNCDWQNYNFLEFPGGIPFLIGVDHDNVNGWEYPMIMTADRFNQAIITGSSIFGWNATLKFLDGVGIKNIETRVRRLGGYLIDRLQDIGCKVYTPTEPTKRHGLIVYTTGSREKDLKSLDKLNNPGRGKKPIKVSYRGQAGICGLRVSTHFINTKEDIDIFIKNQKELM